MTKAIRWVFAAALLGLAGCKNHDTHIEGNISGMTDRMIYLHACDDVGRGIDSVMAGGGRFELRVPQGPADVLFIRFEGEPNLRVPVIVDGRPVQVAGDFAHPDEITVTGSEANNLLQQYRIDMARYDVMAHSIALDREEIDPAGADSLLFRALTVKQDSVAALRRAARARFVTDHPGSTASAFLVWASLPANATRTQVDSLLNILDTTRVANAFLDRLREARKTSLR